MTRANGHQQYATPAQVEQAMQHWSEAVIRCRTRGHDFVQRHAVHVVRYRYWRVEFECSHGCLTERYEEWNEQGVPITGWIIYPKNSDGTEAYLLKGMGRITTEGKGPLRLASVAKSSEVITEVDESYAPRSAITREEVGRRRSAREVARRLGREA